MSDESKEDHIHFSSTHHSLLLTPHSSLITPHSLLLTPHSSLLTRSLSAAFGNRPCPSCGESAVDIQHLTGEEFRGR